MPDSNEKVEFGPGLPNVQINTSSDPFTTGTPPRQHNPAMQQQSFGYEHRPMDQSQRGMNILPQTNDNFVQLFQPSAQHVFQSPGSSFLSPGTRHPWGPNPPYLPNRNYQYHYSSPHQQLNPSYGHTPPYAAQYPGYHPSYPANPYQQGGGYYPQYYQASAMAQSKNLIDESVSPAELRSPSQSLARSKDMDNANEDVEVKNESVLKERLEVQQQRRQGSSTIRKDDKQKQHTKKERIMATASRKLKVSDIPQGVSWDFLQVLFESEKRSGGGEVKALDFDTDLATAIIEFEDPSVIDRVLEKLPLAIKGQQLKIEIYKELYEPEKVAEEEDEHNDLPKTTVEVKGFSEDTSADDLEMYFESKKWSGGGPIRNIDRKDKVALITFESEAVTNAVLQKSHKFGEMNLDVKLYVPPSPVPMYTDKLLITGLNEKITEDCLTNFLEARGGVSPTAILFAEDDDQLKALATFESPPVMATASRKLKVSDIPQGVSWDFLQVLFESEKRSGGGEVKALDFDTDLATAIIEFEDPSVIDRVLEKLPLAIKGQQLKIEIYKELYEPEKVAEEEDEHNDLPKTTVEVKGFSEDTSADDLEMYFENKKWSGGGPIRNIDRKDKVALITFESEAVANTVLQKSHKFGEMNLDVKLYVPPSPVPMYTDKLLITGLNEKITEDCLTNFLEARGGVSPTTILFAEDDDQLKALVTFESPPEFRKLQDACQKKKLEGATLVISQVPISRCVLVTNLASKISEDIVQMYFENSKRSGGGPVEKVEMNKEAGECLIFFEDLNVLDSVLRREHKLGNSEIQLQLFHPCISKTSNVGNKGKLQKHEFASNKAVSKGSKKLTGMDLDDKPCKPVPMYKDKLLINGLNEMITEDCLINFLEARGGVSPTETLYAEDDEKKALVSFESPPDLQKLQDACQKKKLEGATLVMSQVPISRCVLVTNLATTTSKDTVHFYFENARYSGGGHVENVEMNKEAGECLIFFEDLNVVDSVLGRKHLLDNSEIQLQLFHPCIGRTISAENRGKFQNPDSFIFKVNLHFIAFLKQVPNAKVRLEQELSKVHVRLVIPSENSDTLVVFPTLKAEMEGVKRLAKTWKDTAKQNLEAFIQQLDCSEHQVMPDLWASTVTSLQKVQIPNVEDVIVHTDQQQNIIRVVGFKDIVSHVSNNLKQVICDGEKKLELKKQRTSDRRILPQHQIYFLSAVNFPGKVRNICREVECTIQQEDNSIVFEGILLDIKQAQLLMFETIQTIAKSSMSDYSRSKMELLAMKETCDYIRQRLEENGCLGLWESDGNSVIVYDACDQKANEGTQIIKKCLVKNTINMTPEQSGVINSDAWNAMLADINRQHQGQIIIHALVQNSTVEITATDQYAGKIIESVQDFISANTLYKKRVTVDLHKMRYLEQWKKPQIDEICKSQQINLVNIDLSQGVITLQGTQKGLREAEDKMSTLFQQTCSEQKSIKKPGMGKYLFSDKGKELIKDIENVNKCTIDLINEEEVETSLEESQMELQKHLQHPVECLSCKMLGGRTMSVFHGDITDLDIHVLINPCNKMLDHSGGLAKVVVEKGGPVILSECSQLRHQKLIDGDVVYTEGGNLKCKIVAHGVTPIWQGVVENKEEYLKEVVLKSLEETDKRRLTSIGIPAIGTGIFGWPVPVATRVIVRTVQEYFHDTSNSVIKNVYLCDLDAKHLKAFIHAVKEAFPTGDLTFHEDPSQTATRGSSYVGTGSGGSQNISLSDSKSGTSPHRIKVVKGEMSRQQADALVNTTSKSLNLSHGAVSASLLEVGGQELQDECKNKYPNGIKHGEVAITGAGELRSVCVLHGCLPDWNDDGSTLLILKTFMNNCLSAADQKKLTSIAFPALGTGTRKYPKDVVAREMFNCVSDFLTKNANTSLDAVYFVVYQKNLETLMAFEKEEKEFLKRLSSPSKQDGSAEHQRMRRYGGSQSGSLSSSKSGILSHRIKVVKGEMAHQQADALVNTTSNSLNLSLGEVSASLLAFGGQQLQDECKNKYPNGIKHGEVAITGAGGLRSVCVLHGCLPDWNDDGSTLLILKTFMNNCLSAAYQKKLTSIAFPALGTGTLKYPKDVVAREMFNCVSDFLTKNANTSLDAVYFVVYQKNLETLMAFEKEEKEFLKRLSSLSKQDGSAKHQKKLRHGGQAYNEVSTTLTKPQSSEFIQVPQVKIIPGDITTCSVDAIVNPTDAIICLEGGVSRAILRKAGAELKEMCAKLDKEMKKKGFVVTPGFKLACGYIIHVNVRSKQHGWKEIILKCLEEAVKKKLRSIAFPALGTGHVGGNPEEIGKALFEATCEIIQAGKNTLQEIQMVVYQAEMVSKIEDGIKSAQESVPKTSNWFDYVKGLFGYGKKTSTVQPHVHRDDGMKVFIHICADSENVIEDALGSLESNFNKELEIDSITDEVIKRLSDDKVSEIERIGRKHHALTKVEKRLGRVRIEGLHADVGNVKSEVLNLMRGIEKMENKEIKAALLSHLVQWYYIKITADGQDLVEYSKDINATIEEAYQRKEKILRLSADVPIIIDFGTFEEYPITDPDDRVTVLRKDKIKDLVSEIPPQWDPMDKDNLRLILLKPASKEYTDVASLFMATVKKEKAGASVPIAKIERIQNRTLYAQYQSKKKLIDEMNPGQTNEMDLWHGTAGQAVDSINVHGFNRSFCGKNATKYGDGVYFAKESYYSARDLYSPPDAAGNKKMYLTKVLTGKYALGTQGMRVPPPLVPGLPELHDSVVDDINTPSIFVIFHDTQAYPKYLITFKWN